jgi:hypothetical protein
MKIYFAGTTALKKREDLVLGVVKNRLLSFYYVQQYEAGGIWSRNTPLIKSSR